MFEQPTRENPFYSTLLKRKRLNKEGSSKATYHLELKADARLEYAPGDSIAILPSYTEESLKDLIFLFSLPYEKLATQYNFDSFTKKFLRAMSEKEIENRSLLETLLEDREACKAFIAEHTVKSAIALFQPTTCDGLLDSLSPLLPRMYSIASSQREHPDEIHLTVATFTYKKQGEICTGLGSNFLCYKCIENKTPIPFYIHKSDKFKLPHPDTDIIMIGPGTGIAPYRAFLQERRSQKAKGRHWLFFGERNRQTDFYYEDFLTKYALPLKLDLAFSRDQADKIYVQHKMRSQGEELWKWIKKGAVIYICGDAKQMARDVQETLCQIIENEGNHSPEEAKSMLKAMRKDQRLLLDVY